MYSSEPLVAMAETDCQFIPLVALVGDGTPQDGAIGRVGVEILDENGAEKIRRHFGRLGPGFRDG